MPISKNAPARLLAQLGAVGFAGLLAAGAAHAGPPVRTAAAAAPAEAPAAPSPTALAKDPKLEARIAELLGRMSLEQKVAQMIQAEIRSVTPEDVKRYRLGSILNGGGAWPDNDKHATVAAWLKLADRFYDASMDTSGGAPAIPIMWGTDAVHGHNNVLGATLYPHNVALGAAHDPDLVQRIGAATAEEVAATGIDWVFAPTVAVVRDSRWGRAYEGYSERPDVVRAYAANIVQGLQGTAGTPEFLDGRHVIATAKHFIGDGGTHDGIDRGDNRSSEQDLLAIDAQGYLGAIQSGVQAVMASYNSWQGHKVHGERHLLTDVLKTQMGFDGIVVSDWDGIDEVQGCSKDHCARAINAGIDMIMVPDQWKAFLQNTVAQVRGGEIPQARIDDAVTRILRVKLRAGLFEKGRPSARPLGGMAAQIGAPAHRTLAREAVRKSIVLLKNDNCLLPLSPKSHVLVAGEGADNIAKQTGGWSLTWQGTDNSNADFPGATSIYEGIRLAVTAGGGSATLSADGSYHTRPDVAIVVFGESPYAEWHGDLRSLDYIGHDGGTDGQDIDMQRPPSEVSSLDELAAPPAARASAADPDLKLMQKLRQEGIPVAAVFLTGRVRGITPELDAANALAVAWLPGTEGSGVADVLFRGSNGAVSFVFNGKLPHAWPRSSADHTDQGGTPLFPYGYGLEGCKSR